MEPALVGGVSVLGLEVAVFGQEVLEVAAFGQEVLQAAVFGQEVLEVVVADPDFRPINQTLPQG